MLLRKSMSLWSFCVVQTEIINIISEFYIVNHLNLQYRLDKAIKKRMTENRAKEFPGFLFQTEHLFHILV